MNKPSSGVAAQYRANATADQAELDKRDHASAPTATLIAVGPSCMTLKISFVSSISWTVAAH
jgi:hypothetical protein